MAPSNLISMLIIICCTLSVGKLQHHCILVALSLEQGTNYTLDVISDSVNTIRDTLKLLVSSSETDYATVVQFVSNIYQLSFPVNGESVTNGICSNSSDVIGVVGDLDAKTASIISTLASRSNLNVTLVAAVAPSTFLPVTNLALPNVLDMKPLSHYVESLISFIDHWNWTYIGLITDDSYYYQFTAELLQKQLLKDSGIITSPFVRMSGSGDATRALKEVGEYGTRIIILSMKKTSACLLLEKAKKLTYTWPEYAWIVFEVESQEDPTCDMEGIFLLRDRVIEEKQENTTTMDVDLSSVHKFDSNLLNAVSAVLADHIDFTNVTFPGISGLVKLREGKRLYNISIVQIMNSTKEEIAYYDPELQWLNMFYDLLAAGNSPRGSQVVIKFQNSLAGILVVSVMFPLCFIYVTIIFIFYIYFRNEPEIRATSVPVSLCMFVGSYLSLAFVPVLLLKPHIVVCNIQVWLSGIGLSILLIFATLFAKMLRVYVIFFKPYSYRKRMLSNPLLFLYIMLIMLPQVLFLLLWSTLDTFTNVRFEFFKNRNLMVVYRCKSSYTIIWVSLLLLYLFIVMLAVVILVFKSSKLRYKNFKDTKATNAFTFLIIFFTIMTLLYWYFFRSLGVEESFSSILKSAMTLYTGHILLASLGPTLLFVPKVFPPIKRHLFKNVVKRGK